MKKTLLLLISFTLLFTFCKQAEQEKYSVKLDTFTPYAAYPEILNGKVKTIEEASYLAEILDGNFIQGDRMDAAARDSFNWSDDFIVRYDDNGILLQIDYVDENDDIISITKIEIIDGKMHKARDIVNDTLKGITNISYNEKGLADRYENFKSEKDSLNLYSIAMYDDNDNLTSVTVYNIDNEITYKYQFSVNENGSRSGIKGFNKEGELRSDWKIFYNEKGFMKNSIIIDSKGEKEEWTYSYDYDEMDNWIKSYGSSEKINVITERKYSYYK